MRVSVWFMRGIAFVGLLVVAVSAWAYHQWTKPDVVRSLLLERLRTSLPALDVQLGSASLRLLGGLVLTDLRFALRNSHGEELLSIPSALAMHDREELSKGRLRLNRLELTRPRLRLRRGVEGQWAFDEVVPASRADEAVPTLVVRQGTLIIEDNLGGVQRPAWEIHDVELTVLNDPVTRLSFRGAGISPLLGTVRLEGTFERITGALRLHCDIPQATLGQAVVRAIIAYLPDQTGNLRELAGECQLRLTGDYLPSQGWRYDIRGQLSRGRLDHGCLPMPLDELECTARISNGEAIVERCVARAGKARLELSAELTEPAGTAVGSSITPEHFIRRLSMTLRHLELTAGFFARVPPNLKLLQERFGPIGLVSLTYQYERRANAWRKHCRIHPEGLTAVYQFFPYPLEHLNGTLDYTLTSDRVDRLTIDLVGRAKGRPLTLKGRLEGDGPLPEVELDIIGENIALDETLLQALPLKYRSLAESFHPCGQGDIHATIRRGRGEPHMQNCYRIDFHNAAMKYDRFPYALNAVEGTLTIHTKPDGRNHWDFRGFTGQHGSARLSVAGCGGPADLCGLNSDQHDIFLMDIEGRDLPLDDDFAAALRVLNLTQAWQKFEPSGRADFKARLMHTRSRQAGESAPGEISLAVAFRGASIRPDFFPYLLTDTAAQMNYSRGRVVIANLTARHGAAQLRIPSTEVILRPEGGVWAEIRDAQLAPFMPDEDLTAALPPGLRDACSALHLQGELGLSLRQMVVDVPNTKRLNEPTIAVMPVAYTARGVAESESRPRTHAIGARVAPPWVYWDATLSLTNARLRTGVDWMGVHGEVSSRGEHRGGRLGRVVSNLYFQQAILFRQPVEAIQARLDITPDEPDVLKIGSIYARVFGGDVQGKARLLLDSPPRFDLELNAVQVKLDEIARHNRLGPDVELRGLANAQLFLSSRGPDGAAIPTGLNLSGGGTVDVPSGQIAKLPPLMDLLKFLNLRAPDRTAFEEAHAVFTVRGERVEVSQLDLLGSALSLSGNGSMNLDGSQARFDFYAVLSRLTQMLPPVISDASVAISKGLFKIEMTGQIGQHVDYRKEPVPVIVDPVMRAIQWMRGKSAE